MNGPDPRWPERVDPMVESYLAELGARLAGPARAHVEIVAELRSGLLDAADAYQAAGLPPKHAAQAAIGEFGELDEVADGFRAEIAARQARRVSIGLLTSGPLVGLLWIAAALTSHLGVQFGTLAAPIGRWPGLSLGLRWGVCLAAAAIAVEVWAMLLGIAATGRLTRWMPLRPRRAPTAAAVAGFGAASADAVMLSLLAVELATASGGLSPLVVALAATASLIRLTLASRAARRCMAYTHRA